MRPRRSVWSVPQRLGTFITQRLWTFIMQAAKAERGGTAQAGLAGTPHLIPPSGASLAFLLLFLGEARVMKLAETSWPCQDLLQRPLQPSPSPRELDLTALSKAKAQPEAGVLYTPRGSKPVSPPGMPRVPLVTPVWEDMGVTKQGPKGLHPGSAPGHAPTVVKVPHLPRWAGIPPGCDIS